MEEEPKFPCTISYSIRQGPPRWAHHVSWLVGWCAWGTVFFHGDSTSCAFGLHMFLSGVLAVVICPLDRGPLSDVGHCVGALIYISCHIVLLSWLAIPTLYCYVFVTCFAVMIAGLVFGRIIECSVGLPRGEHDVDKALRSQELAKAPEHVKRLLFVAELMAMLGENGLFIAFVIAMPMGLSGERPTSFGDHF